MVEYFAQKKRSRIYPFTLAVVDINFLFLCTTRVLTEMMSANTRFLLLRLITYWRILSTPKREQVCLYLYN